jgi:RNA polymerase sigma-70 factor (sigma-E family)
MSNQSRGLRAASAAGRGTAVSGLAGPGQADAQAAVTALYEAHALGLVRLAHVMLGDRAAAEDVVQEAFGGLYRRWAHLSDQGKALQYVRSAVLNGSRSALRRRRDDRTGHGAHELPAVSAEAALLTSEERREVMRALRQLPDRQREILVLRFYLDESDAEIARLLGIGQSTVRSATHRALAALGRLLGEES